MTQEEKARAYDEALERAMVLRQEAIDKGYALDYIKDYETIFPELAESEDERIRKALICGLSEGLSEHNWQGFGGATIDECIAYLEKQKINTEGDFARGYDCGYECCLNSHGAEWFEKQKEQDIQES